MIPSVQGLKAVGVLSVTGVQFSRHHIQKVRVGVGDNVHQEGNLEGWGRYLEKARMIEVGAQ